MTSGDPDAADLRERQRRNWSAAAPAWQPAPGTTPGAGDAVTGRLLDLARIAPGMRVLDLACGGGNPAFAIVDRVGPEGKVLGLDISEAMIEGARATAARLAIHNVAFRRIEAEDALDVSAAAYDAATCRHGLMFMPDRLAALRALVRAVRTGGRIAASCWGGLARNPSINLTVEAVQRHLTLGSRDLAELTRPFTALPDAAALGEALRSAGMAEVEVVEAPGWTEAAGPAEHWQSQLARNAPLLAFLRDVPEDTVRAIRDDTIASFAAQYGNGPLRLPNLSLVAGGTVAM